jgi:hypothetical protein
MRRPGKSLLLRGFENPGFRAALDSFLKEKCPEAFEAHGDVPLQMGLQIVRQFILKKREERETHPVPVPAS